MHFHAEANKRTTHCQSGECVLTPAPGECVGVLMPDGRVMRQQHLETGEPMASFRFGTSACPNWAAICGYFLRTGTFNIQAGKDHADSDSTSH